MANEAKTKAAETSGTMAIVAPLAGWLVPGLGHILLKRWARGGLIFLSVSIMFFAGVGMQGKVYAFNLGQLLDILGSRIRRMEVMTEELTAARKEVASPRMTDIVDALADQDDENLIEPGQMVVT